MASIYAQNPLDFSQSRTVSIHERGGKVRVADFAGSMKGIRSPEDFINSLPGILAGNDLREVLGALRRARTEKRAILWGLGGHVIKTGMAPVLAELMDAGFVTGFAMNGSAAIHDFEIALAGCTSEDVEAVLPDGRFGTAEETGSEMNRAIQEAVEDETGMGEALGKRLSQTATLSAGASILFRAYQAKVPVTVHVALGTDTIHTHRKADGALTGAASLHDFRLFSNLITGLHDGGVYINLGSAVVMPEVFLKALSTVRNLGFPVRNFTTVNIDQIQHYRPRNNVVQRPHKGDGSGKGYALTGHHEILLPLIAAALLNSSVEAHD